MDLTREEIQKQLDSVENEFERIDLMNIYCLKLLRKDDELGDDLSALALSLSRKTEYSKGIAQALIHRGIIAYHKRNYDDMFDSLNESEAIINRLADGKKLGLHRLLNCKAVYYFNTTNYPKSLELFERALELSREAGDLNLVGSVYLNLAVIYGKIMGKRDAALEYCLEAYNILKHGDNYISIVHALNNAATNLAALEEYSRALGYLHKAHALIKEKQLTDREALILINFSDVYMKMGDFEKAEKSIIASRELTCNIPGVEVASLIGLGRLCIKLQQLDRAEEALLGALDVMEKHSIKYDEAEVHTMLDTIYIQKREFEKAHFHLKRSMELEKKVYALEMDNKLKRFEEDSLRQVNRRIKIISTIGQEITSTLDMNMVLDLIYENINSVMDATIFGIALFDRDKHQIDYRMFVENGVHLSYQYRSLDDKTSLLALVIRENRDILISDFKTEYKQFLPEAGDFLDCVTGDISEENEPRSILCCPLSARGEVTGGITVQSYKKNAYTISDLDSLKALASYVAIALKNAGQAGFIKEQNKALTKANDKLKKDIQLSRQLQLAMIPRVFPVSPMYKIYGYFNFLDEVGGDLYDVYRISPDKTVILILDVVGHGVSAALVTAMAKILFFNKSKEYRSASEVVEAVNRELTPITGDSFTYFSLFYGIINSKEHNLQYVNAAHPEPFLIRECGRVELLGSSSLFVGLKEDFCYEQKVIDLEKGDRLVLFTDGFFEMRGKDKKRFGEKRLLEILVRYKKLDPGQVLEKLNLELESYQSEKRNEADDDKTMLIVDIF